MVGNDHVWGLSLQDQRLNHSVNRMQFLLRQVNACSGRYKPLRVHAVGGNGIVVVFEGNGAFISWFITAITNKRGFADPPALFQLKAVTDFITDMAGPTVGITKKKLLTSVGPAASEPVDAKVVGIVEAPPIP